MSLSFTFALLLAVGVAALGLLLVIALVVLVVRFDSFGNEVRTSLRRELDRDCQSSALVQTLLSPRGQFGLLDDGQSC